jgi:hypothetical protein
MRREKGGGAGSSMIRGVHLQVVHELQVAHYGGAVCVIKDCRAVGVAALR